MRSEDKEQRELAIVMLSNTLKEVIRGRYEPAPWFAKETSPEERTYYKEQTIRGLQLAMNELAKDLDLPNDLKASLVMSESDLGRFRGSGCNRSECT